MRTSACLAAIAALALTPIAASAQSASAQHAFNSDKDFAYTPPPSTGCTGGQKFNSNMNKSFVMECDSEEHFLASFSFGDNMGHPCVPGGSRKVICTIVEKSN